MESCPEVTKSWAGRIDITEVQRFGDQGSKVRPPAHRAYGPEGGSEVQITLNGEPRTENFER
jgi:hypothetical protein